MSKKNSLVDASWICPECGALNASYLEDCGRCIEKTNKKDPIVDLVVGDYLSRSKTGISKYGTTLQDNNLSLLQWLTHLQEELMDATLYIEKLKQEQIKNIEVNES